ncbi:30S ribosomal protein S20 [Candidatus Cytomitobacter indipagum]|uniref:Small ribosomal subunit protein bS20 n=1 Tax=Candidatus Cytomitobacter indipagum TaxID=2601575 RepID=A0A5C0UFI2_9PROT|nr:30S ribosomal protein S20 [Candidatus Cytomitobacter indipagum]QEK37814.1 30S ribosomal protein S20 [Candidatus Cytomitobacter indipagum]
MANHTATKKRIRRDENIGGARGRNKSALSTMRTSIKALRKSIENAEKNVELFRKTQSCIARCGRKRIVHPANADRKIERLAKLFNKI